MCGGGVHLLLLPDGRRQLPSAAGPARLLRPGGRATDSGCHQEAEAGSVWQQSSPQRPLQPAGVLRGRHATRLPGEQVMSVSNATGNAELDLNLDHDLHSPGSELSSTALLTVNQESNLLFANLDDD